MAKLLTENDFEKEVMQADKLTVVDFFTQYCAPCKALEPVLNDIANHFNGKANIFKIDATQAMQLSKKYAIKRAPTLLYFKNAEIVDRTGALPKDDLIALISSHL